MADVRITSAASCRALLRDPHGDDAQIDSPSLGGPDYDVPARAAGTVGAAQSPKERNDALPPA